MSDVTVRQAALSEMPRIAALKRQIHEVHVEGRPDLFAPFSNPEIFADHAAEKDCSLLLAEIGDRPVGFVLYQFMDRPSSPYMNERHFLHVEEFCVDENCRRMGIGRKMMDALRIAAREKGYSRIELDVWAFNEGAKQFYEAVGMRPFRYFMEMNADE